MSICCKWIFQILSNFLRNSVWDMKEKKLMFDLPGHADEVYAVDWSPDGQKVVSGGKDKLLRL